jgi:formate dehydrogenase major subunit
VGIDYLKRYVSDFDLISNSPYTPDVKPANGKKVAIIGGGPAGLTTAYYLQIAGFQADIYEQKEAAGGWLRYGIPEYRLPNAILDREIENITKLGVKIFTNQQLGKNLKYADLEKKYDAIFLSIGAQEGDLLGIGENSAPNLVSGIDFLKNNAETGNDLDLRGKKVVVVGGGNTAMDCCRSARRCGSTKVIVLYRRTEADMPANPIEIHESKVEGVEYIFLAAPKAVYYNDKGELTGLQCIKMKAEKLPGSRRSNIVPIEGSEFDLPCDLVLPATGQKIQYEVLDHINEYYAPLSLKLNKWKTLDANETTFQMNIPKIFAAGDAVTGPTNIIQAVAGGKAAAKYIEQYVFNIPFQAPTLPFISTKDNFEIQNKEEYQNKFSPCYRYEMPVLPENERHNFDEVELGYTDKELILEEAERCLECGCTAFYNCKLQQYATQYGVNQKHYQGYYPKFETNFPHPQIELDNNKCILCGRCVRVCREYSGNRAWEFFKRGSKTFIAPNMEGKLLESSCDACGLCVDTCPTGALSENVITKILPLPYEKTPAIDPFGSEGLEVDLLMYKNKVYGATTREGIVNQYGLINRDIKFGYSVYNKKDRITHPMVRENGKLHPISVEEAIERIKNEVSKVKSEENAICVAPEITNESMYMIQKWARAGLKTNAIGSTSYKNNGIVFNVNKNDNLQLHELKEAKQVYIFGTNLAQDHPVVSHIVQNMRYEKQIPVAYITQEANCFFSRRVDETIQVKDEHAFIRAINYYLLKSGKAFGIFLEGLALNFEAYKAEILLDNYEQLLEKSGVGEEIIKKMAQALIDIPESVIIVSEKTIDLPAFCELKNTMFLTEKHGKMYSGLMTLKKSCNSQGIYDMGIHPEYGPGFRKIEGEYLELLTKVWKTNDLPTQFERKEVKNFFVFGENAIGEHSKMAESVKSASFVCIQSLFENETTALADLVLPMNFAIEIGGSFTSSFKVAQTFNAIKTCEFGWNDYQFYARLQEAFGIKGLTTPDEIFLEMISLLQPGCCSDTRHRFEV